MNHHSFIASHLNRKNCTDLGWITPDFQSERLWVPALMWHNVFSMTEGAKDQPSWNSTSGIKPLCSWCSLLHSDNDVSAPITQRLHFLRGHIISPYYAMCIHILGEYISRKSFFLEKIFSLFIYVFYWAPVCDEWPSVSYLCMELWVGRMNCDNSIYYLLCIQSENAVLYPCIKSLIFGIHKFS